MAKLSLNYNGGRVKMICVILCMLGAALYKLRGLLLEHVKRFSDSEKTEKILHIWYGSRLQYGR